MAVTKLVTTSVKPAGASWFSQVEPALVKELVDWVEVYAGLLTSEGKEANPTTWQNTFVFESRARCDAFLIEYHNSRTHLARQAYHNSNNYVYTFEITEL